MLIKDIAVYLKSGFISSFAKMARQELSPDMKNYIEENHLYHITSDAKTAETIANSEYLKAATGIMKNINSYGTAGVCLFAGAPDIEDYIKNLTDANLKKNPYLNPTMIANAVEIDVKSKELKNYKVRGLADNVIFCEGYCILPHERVKSVQLVPDLIRDKAGNPIFDKKTGEPVGVNFRKRTEEEIKKSPNEYIPSKDYLDYMKIKGLEYGYKDGNNIIQNAQNLLKTIIHEGEIEGKSTSQNFRANFANVIKNRFQKLTQIKIDENVDSKINRIMEEFTFKNKNPYRDEKFALAVAEFQKEGLTQMKLNEELDNLTKSEEGKFFRAKMESLDKTPIRKKGIHGINHNNRVAMHTMIIAKNEGLLTNDKDNKMKDILLNAAYYHDIGRIGNIGPHSRRSAKLVDKIDLRFENGKMYSIEDRKLLKFLIHGHEGNDKDFDKLAKKYEIPEDKKQEAIDMLRVIKDADALDRVRIDSNLPFYMKTDLNPKYLRTDTAKRMLNASYELENLTKKVDFEHIIAYKTEGQKEEKKDEMQIAKKKFENSIKVELSKLPQIHQKAKQTLNLCKEKMSYIGYGVKDKMKNILNLSKTKKKDDFER